MSRHARIVIPGLPHHITQRGNYRQPIFKEPVDFWKYCYWINKYALRHALDILAYCLMSNHVHFIVIPRQANSLAMTFQIAHMRYAQHINRKKQLKGHLWEGRFFSCILQDEAYLYRAVRYVEQNPVRAGIAKEAWNYRWSSARWRLGLEREPAIHLKKTAILSHPDWKKYLQEKDLSAYKEIKIKTQKGLVAGDQEFIDSLEKKFGVSLQGLRLGRPPKKTSPNEFSTGKMGSVPNLLTAGELV